MTFTINCMFLNPGEQFGKFFVFIKSYAYRDGINENTDHGFHTGNIRWSSRNNGTENSIPKTVIESESERGVYRRVPLKPEAEQEAYFERAIQAGLGMADRRLTRTMVNGAPEAKTTLARWGLVLDESPFLDGLIANHPLLS